MGGRDPVSYSRTDIAKQSLHCSVEKAYEADDDEKHYQNQSEKNST